MLVCGVDEVGRGCLAGPVVAAAVILPDDHGIVGIKDSKKLTPKARIRLDKEIRKKALSVGLGELDSHRIDDMGILNATLVAMRNAINSLGIRPDLVLVDGDHLIPYLDDLKQKSILQGDDTVPVISAASIVAKVYRDTEISSMASMFPEYKWQDNKGYGTKKHIEAIKEHGFTKHHRRSFNIKRLMET